MELAYAVEAAASELFPVPTELSLAALHVYEGLMRFEASVEAPLGVKGTKGESDATSL